MKKALSLVLALMMLVSVIGIVPVVAADAPAGSAENPIYVNTPNKAPGTVSIPANGAVYYQYKATVFRDWSVTVYGATSVVVDGVVFDEMDHWGQIQVPFNFTFKSPGIVAYVNDTDEAVDVTLTHNEPLGSEKNPDTLVAGVNSLSIPSNLSGAGYVADFLPTANGKYTFSTALYEDFLVSVDIDGTTYSLEEGSLTLELESYINVRFYISPVGTAGEVDIVIETPKAGTATNPIWLEIGSYAVTAGDTYFSVDGQWTGNTLTVESENGADFVAMFDGVEYYSEGGKVSAVLDAGDWYIELIVTSAEALDLVFSMEYAVGTYENPIQLADGDNEIAIPENGYYYYSYTAEKDGLLVLTPADASVFSLLDIGYEDAALNYHYAYLAEGASAALLSVPAGQTVTISACGVFNEDTFVSDAVNTTLNVTVKDLLLYNTFEGADSMGDLEGWTSASDLVLEEIGEESNVANGLYSAELTTTAAYANMYQYVTVEANTDYEVTFKAMASEESTLWIKLNDNWTADVAQADVKIGTEWAEYTVTIHTDDYTDLVLLFQHAGENVVTYWFDDIVITKVADGDTPVEIVYGDANGDGEVNNVDVALLQQYINKWNVTLDEAADANGDGEVNNVDVALLQQYVNKWDIVLGPQA